MINIDAAAAQLQDQTGAFSRNPHGVLHLNMKYQRISKLWAIERNSKLRQ